MNINMSCSFPGCTEPINGQCMGYNGQCGRFYCAKHSVGRLCNECAIEQKKDKIEKTYRDRAQACLPRLGVRLLAVFGSFILPSLIAFSTDDIPTGFIVFSLILFSELVVVNIMQMIYIRENVDAASKDLPEFKEYFKAWKKQRNREMNMVLGGIVIATAAGAVLGLTEDDD